MKEHSLFDQSRPEAARPYKPFFNLHSSLEPSASVSLMPGGTCMYTWWSSGSSASRYALLMSAYSST